MSEISLDVSVLIPVYIKTNVDEEVRLLKRAITSAMEQEYPGQMEVVIIDDGSVIDLSRTIMPDFPQSVRVITHKRNRGLVAALNTGLHDARYPLIARLDADDLWVSGKIKAQLEQFAADRNLTLSATGMVCVSSQGGAIATHIRPVTWSGILDFFVQQGCPFPHGSVVARKDIYLLLGGYSADPYVAHCEDYHLWGTWVRFFKPEMIAKVLYEYTVSNTSVSSIHAQQQRSASGGVRALFQGCGITPALPSDMESLSVVLGTGTLEAGIICYLLWKNPNLSIGVPFASVDLIQKILPDRNMEKDDGNGKPWDVVVSDVMRMTRSPNTPRQIDYSVRAVIA